MGLAEITIVTVLLLSPLAAIAFAVALWKARARLSSIHKKYQPMIDADLYAANITGEAHKKVHELHMVAEREKLKISKLIIEYKEKKEIFDKLASQVAIFDETLSFSEMGVYKPHYEFTDSEEYKIAMSRVRDAQKAMVVNKAAVTCPTAWTVDGSQSKGKTMTNRNIRLTLRAFNGECDAAIANVRWNNANAMEKRISQAFQQITKLNESNHVFISQEYVKLKFEELFLTHEYREKLKHEKDERAESARLSREEQKLLRDLERAEEDEARYEKLLAKAKAEAASVDGQRLEVFAEQIKILERDLAEAHAKVERAQAMAERTRTGYVYIISNVGSFGEGVVKIGLTRRLDPSDRVRELGDASVPFVFDTHAMIYSEDAPALERALHAEFDSGRVNGTNLRKEFFRASIDDVEIAVKRLAPQSPFFRDIEAQEFRESIAIRQERLQNKEAVADLFPTAL
ncbi:MAG: DUF4041 domain-containing protein [Pseudomonadota bacterium]